MPVCSFCQLLYVQHFTWVEIKSYEVERQRKQAARPQLLDDARERLARAVFGDWLRRTSHLLMSFGPLRVIILMTVFFIRNERDHSALQLHHILEDILYNIEFSKTYLCCRCPSFVLRAPQVVVVGTSNQLQTVFRYRSVVPCSFGTRSLQRVIVSSFRCSL